MKVQDITEYFIKRPTIFWSLVACIVIGGILSFIQMPKLEDPAVCAKQANVVAIYQGATAHEVELKVAKVLEDQLRTLPDVKEIRTECTSGMAVITVEFQMTVLNDQIEQHFDLLRRKVNDSKMLLPQDAMAPMVIDDMMDTYGLFYSMSFDGYTYPEAERYAKYVRNQLLTVPGVKRVNVVGTRDEQIDVVVTKEQLAQNGLTSTLIMMQMQNQGKVCDAGKYDAAGHRYNIRVSDGLENEKDIEDMLIKTTSGQVLRVGDIAEVKRTYKEPQTNGFFVDGTPAIALCIALESGVVVPDVGKAVDKRMEETLSMMPVGFNVQKIFFQPDKVNAAISGFLVNLLESVLVVIVLLMFFMGFRSGLIIGVGLALTIAASFPVLMVMGSTLQRISLGAFIIAMGMLVDNSIVIMDGIRVDKMRGLAPKKYLYSIGNKTAIPLLGATIIAVSTFLPVYLSPDSAGEYCRDLFLVLCVSLLLSWVLALVQVPMCAKSWMDPYVRKGKNSTLKDPFNTPLHRVVRKLLEFLIKWKKTTIAVSFTVLVLCGIGMTKVKNLFFPDFDYNQFVIEYTLPAQSSPDMVRTDLMKIMAELDSMPKVDRVAMSMGCAPAHYCLVRPMTNGGDNYGELIVDAKDFETVNEIIKEIKPKLRRENPDAYIRFRRYNFSVATTHTVEVRFSGPDPAVLKNLAGQAAAVMRKSPYIDAYSVENNWQAVSKRYLVDFNQNDALRAGLSRGNVSDALHAATDGLPIGVVSEADKSLIVNLKIKNADGTPISDLNDIPVWSMMNMRVDMDKVQGLMTGATKSDEITKDMFRSVPLSSVTDGVKVDWEEPFIFRVNGERTIEVECDPNTDLYEGTTAKAVESIKDEIESIKLPKGYSMQWAGETKLQNDAMVNIFKFIPITVFIILALLLLLFGSWKMVLLILCCLPFVITGIVPALLSFRQPFTFMAIIGLMGLMGMMVKNGIVLVDEIKRLYKEEGKTPYQAVMQATISRVIPVLMASSTTILGMAPLVPDPMYGSMAMCIMAGLTMGTVITLLLLPVFYSAIYKINKA